jgi:DNA-binding NtrC family response regulator
MSETEGQEVLIVDGDERVLEGMRALLSDAGLRPTLVSDIRRARALLSEKYFAAAVVDLDTPGPNGALPLLHGLRKEAPGTTVIVVTARQAFEAAVEAFRAGAADVVVKAPSELEYLKRRVVAACAHVELSASNERLLHDVFALHEDFLRRLMDTSRRAAELEEKLGGGAHTPEADATTHVLVVEQPEDRWLSDALRQGISGRPGIALERISSGAVALDLCGRRRFQIVLVHESLPDLPGSMVVSTIKSHAPETIAIQFSRPGARPGRADVHEGSRIIPLVGELSSPAQLVDRLEELRQAFVGKSRERRYLADFRQQNYELLRRFADLKQKLKGAVEN